MTQTEQYAADSLNQARKALRDLSERLGSLAMSIKSSFKGDWDATKLRELEKFGYKVADEVTATNHDLDGIL